MIHCPFCDAPLDVFDGHGYTRAKCSLCGERIDAYDLADLYERIAKRLVNCNPEEWKIQRVRKGRRR